MGCDVYNMVSRYPASHAFSHDWINCTEGSASTVKLNDVSFSFSKGVWKPLLMSSRLSEMIIDDCHWHDETRGVTFDY